MGTRRNTQDPQNQWIWENNWKTYGKFSKARNLIKNEKQHANFSKARNLIKKWKTTCKVFESTESDKQNEKQHKVFKSTESDKQMKADMQNHQKHEILQQSWRQTTKMCKVELWSTRWQNKTWNAQNTILKCQSWNLKCQSWNLKCQISYGEMLPWLQKLDLKHEPASTMAKAPKSQQRPGKATHYENFHTPCRHTHI